MRLLTSVKGLFVSPQHKPYRILTGPFQGIVMGLSLQSQMQIYLGLFEKETHPWLKRLSQGIATAVDIGVAHGEHTLFFLLKTKAARILAFEPDSGCVPFLRENLKLNSVDQSKRLEISHKFVGTSDNDQEVRLDTL